MPHNPSNRYPIGDLRTGALEILPLRPEDLDYILEIERLSFPSPWTKTLFLGELENPGALLRIVKIEDRIIGYLALVIVLDEVHLTSIAIHPEFRRQGIGRILLTRTLEHAFRAGGRYIFLEVREKNIPALSFYRDLGLVPAGVRRRYYQDTGENALLLHGEIGLILSVSGWQTPPV